MRSKKRHPIIIQEVYDTKKIKKICLPFSFNFEFEKSINKENEDLSQCSTLQNISSKCFESIYSTNRILSKSSNTNLSANSCQTNIMRKLIISERIKPFQINSNENSFTNLSNFSLSTLRSDSSNNFLYSNNNIRQRKNSSLNSSSTWNSDHYFDSFMEEVDLINDDDRRIYENYDKELSEEDTEFLLANTGFNFNQIKKWHDEFKLKCPLGLIEYEQFETYYNTLLPDYMSEIAKENLIRKLFKLFDIDGDEYLNFSEFLVSFWIRFKAPTREKFTWLFNMFDSDRNGHLNYAEFTNALKLCLNQQDLNDLLDILKLDYKKLLEKELKAKRINLIEKDQNFFQIDTDEENSLNLFSKNVHGQPPECLSDEEFSLFLSKNNNRQQQSYSTKLNAQILDEKLNNVLILFDLILRIERKPIYENLDYHLSNDFDENKIYSNDDSYFNLNDEKTIKSEIFFKGSPDYINYFSNRINKLSIKNSRIEFSREDFLYLCEKYKLLRKLLLPIECFYDNITV